MSLAKFGGKETVQLVNLTLRETDIAQLTDIWMNKLVFLFSLLKISLLISKLSKTSTMPFICVNLSGQYLRRY